MGDPDPFSSIEDSRTLAQAIVDTIREPLLVLDKDLRVVAASRSFFLTFRMNRQDVQGRPIYALGNGQWDIPELRLLLERILPQHTVMDDYEVEQEFSVIGRRNMVLNARTVFYEKQRQALILLAIEDITLRRTAERGLAELLEQKETLLQEMQHRVANSLQIIASILLLKARTVQSDETRLHLQDAHRRVMSVAAVQQQLQAIAPRRAFPDRPLSVAAVRHPGRVDDRRGPADPGRSPGRRGRRLVDRGGQHRADRHRAGDQRAEARLPRHLDRRPDRRLLRGRRKRPGGSWCATTASASPRAPPERRPPGLGTSIVEALAKQLEGHVEISRTVPHGMTVSITHGAFPTRLPDAA